MSELLVGVGVAKNVESDCWIYHQALQAVVKPSLTSRTEVHFKSLFPPPWSAHGATTGIIGPTLQP